jgi:hypothetical protein
MRMTSGSLRVRQYDDLIARAFNGAIVVDGTRIVAHPSGLLWVRTPNQAPPAAGARPAALDRDSDWSDL